MINFYALIFIFLRLYSPICLSNTDGFKEKLSTESCSDLMLGLIKDSSFNTVFNDRNLLLEFYFERSSERYMILKFVKRAGADRNGIYANLLLDFKKYTLSVNDSSPSIFIRINKQYIPFIADKCTPDENLYGNTGHLPDGD